jgi:hypothetical protein
LLTACGPNVGFDHSYLTSSVSTLATGMNMHTTTNIQAMRIYRRRFPKSVAVLRTIPLVMPQTGELQYRRLQSAGLPSVAALGGALTPKRARSSNASRLMKNSPAAATI